MRGDLIQIFKTKMELEAKYRRMGKSIEFRSKNKTI